MFLYHTTEGLRGNNHKRIPLGTILACYLGFAFVSHIPMRLFYFGIVPLIVLKHN